MVTNSQVCSLSDLRARSQEAEKVDTVEVPTIVRTKARCSLSGRLSLVLGDRRFDSDNVSSSLCVLVKCTSISTTCRRSEGACVTTHCADVGTDAANLCDFMLCCLRW